MRISKCPNKEEAVTNMCKSKIDEAGGNGVITEALCLTCEADKKENDGKHSKNGKKKCCFTMMTHNKKEKIKSI